MQIEAGHPLVSPSLSNRLQAPVISPTPLIHTSPEQHLPSPPPPQGDLFIVDNPNLNEKENRRDIIDFKQRMVIE
jgi:hypothetical protein